MKTMLCLVASNTDEQGVEQIGRIVGSRLSRAAKARRLTAGQVHYLTNGVVSPATVSALLRGAISNPGIGTVMAVAGALGLSLEEVTGNAPLPEASAATPPEADVDARLERLERMMRTVLGRGIADRELVAEALEADRAERPPTHAAKARRSGGARKD